MTHQLKMRYGVKLTVPSQGAFYLCEDASLGNKKEGKRYDSPAQAQKALDAYVALTKTTRRIEVCAMEAA